MAANKSRRIPKGLFLIEALAVSTHSRVFKSQHRAGSTFTPRVLTPNCNHRIRSRALAPTPLIGRNGGSWYPKRCWEGSGWGSGNPLTGFRRLETTCPHRSPSPTSDRTLQVLPWSGPNPRRGTTDRRVSGAVCLALPRNADRQPNTLLFVHRPGLDLPPLLQRCRMQSPNRQLTRPL